MPASPERRGLNAVEVIIVVAILGILALTLLMTLPGRRETARRASCQMNLMQVGIALVLYDQQTNHLPVVLDPGSGRGDGPLAALLETLGQPDLREMRDPGKPPPKHPGLRIEERRVPGFVCTSDPNATGGLFPAPVSYRATAGDRPDGADGAFAPDRRISLSAIEAGDGLGYTAAFSERLVGNNRAVAAPENFARVPGPLPPGGCPEAAPGAWRGDAGASWLRADWRSNLYNHALTPNAAPSCLADDGRSAFMGASSGHPGGVNVLIFDGSVRLHRAGIDPAIWRALATPGVPEESPAAGRSDGR
jgi:prepilin-type N-terminal cleavage/methylation domain-containing protein/prepilin-type processing-associated H-X9-DG protein